MKDITIQTGIPGGAHPTFFIDTYGLAVSTLEPDRRTLPIVEPGIVGLGDQPFWPWGLDNLEPQNIAKDILRNDFIMPAIEKKAKINYGQGLGLFRVEMVESPTGWEEKLVQLNIPEINRWLKDTDINTYIHQVSIDKIAFNNFFPEVILGKYTNKINHVHRIDALDCRLSTQNQKGQIEKVIVNANWDGGYQGINSIVVDALDTGRNLAAQIAAKKHIYKYIIPQRVLSMGEKYYAKEALYGLRQSGWLDITASIPKWKTSVMTNQLTIKYHLQIAAEWWEWKYPGYKSFNAEKKEELQKKEVLRFLSSMRGEGNAGNVVITSVQWDPITKAEFGGWKIIPLDNSKFDSANDHLDYADAADLRTIRALGMHPTLFGAGKGKGSAGSGSDIRVAQNQAILESKADQDEILKVLDLVSEVNGWNQTYAGETGALRWEFKAHYVARLDSGKEISKKPEAHTTNQEEG